MNSLHDKTFDTSTFALPSGAGIAAKRRSASDFGVRRRRAAPATLQSENWRRRSEKWRHLMVAAQGGESRAYDQLLRELDAWLRRYYGRRLPSPVAEDARQDALLAIHTKRHAYTPSKPFGPWVAAIARYKWIDHIRDASRFASLSLPDEIMTVNIHRGLKKLAALAAGDAVTPTAAANSPKSLKEHSVPSAAWSRGG